MEVELTHFQERRGTPAPDTADSGAQLTDTLARTRAMGDATDHILDHQYPTIDVNVLLQRQGGGQ